jgi:hypothetical protein
MEYKVAELEGALLDAAVAKAEGHNFRIFSETDSPIGRPLTIAWRQFHSEGDADEFEASSDWAVGGPIIERERIAIAWTGDAWMAFRWDNHSGYSSGYIDVDRFDADGIGPTPLIAAMRAYVASQFGETVELP